MPMLPLRLPTPASRTDARTACNVFCGCVLNHGNDYEAPMDDQAAKVLSYLDYAIESLTIEREYFRAKAKDPFVSSANRVRAMAVFTQLDAQITELVERRDAMLAGYRNGTIDPPSSALVSKALAATKALAAEIQNATKVEAVLDSLYAFLTVLRAIDGYGNT